MSRSRVNLVVALFVSAAWGCTSSGNTSSDAKCSWNEYTNHPSEEVSESLQECLAGCNYGTCPDLQPTSEQVIGLTRIVGMGSDQAAALGVAALPMIGGGDLEDLMRSLGALSGESPEALLKAFRRYETPSSQVGAIVRMLPLTTVDNPREKLRLVRRRLERLQGVSDATLVEFRDAALKSLDAYAVELAEWVDAEK